MDPRSIQAGNPTPTKLLGRMVQSHNGKLLEVTENNAIFNNIAYPIQWIEDHAFFFKYESKWWYYIRNGNKYEVISYTPDTGYHTLVPM